MQTVDARLVSHHGQRARDRISAPSYEASRLGCGSLACSTATTRPGGFSCSRDQSFFRSILSLGNSFLPGLTNLLLWRTQEYQSHSDR